MMDSFNDTCLKYEVPQRHKYTFKVNFEKQLSKQTHWSPIDITDAANYTYLIPGAQCTETVDGVAITKQRQYTRLENKNGSIQWSKDIFQNMQSWPMLTVGQPKVPDETGYMKFRFQIRMSVRLHVLFHLLPQWANNTLMTCIERQVVDLPQATPVALTEKKMRKYRVPKLSQPKEEMNDTHIVIFDDATFRV